MLYPILYITKYYAKNTPPLVLETNGRVLGRRHGQACGRVHQKDHHLRVYVQRRKSRYRHDLYELVGRSKELRHPRTDGSMT